MAETQSIEKVATKILVKYLEDNDRQVTKSKNRTYDLIVDGNYCEIKAKKKPLKDLDYVSLTSNQMKGLKEGELHTLYLVCNTGAPDSAEIYEISNKDLEAIDDPKEIIHYEYNRSMIKEAIRRGAPAGSKR